MSENQHYIAVDEALLATIEKNAERARQFSPRAAEAAKQAINGSESPSLSAFRPKQWPALRQFEIREHEAPEDIREAIRDDNTPQALLRDLFRPVPKVRAVHLIDNDLNLPKGAGAVGEELRGALACDYRQGIEIRDRASEIGRPYVEECFRLIHNSSWAEMLPDDRDKLVETTSFFDAQESSWWTSEGGYDPDQ